MNNRLPHITTALTGVLALAIAGCNTEGQDPLQPRLEMSIKGPESDGPTDLPALPQGRVPSCGGEFSPEVRVEVEFTDGSGVPNEGDAIQGVVTSRSPGSSGQATISRLNDPDEDIEDPTDPAQNECVAQYGAVPVDRTAGVGRFFLTGHVAGEVEFRASTTVGDATVETSKTLTVGSNGNGLPESFFFSGPQPKQIPINGDSREFFVVVVDNGGNPVPDPVDSEGNLVIEIVGNPPQGTALTNPDAEGRPDVQTLQIPTDDGRARFRLGGALELGEVDLRLRAFDTTGDAGAQFAPAEREVTIPARPTGFGALQIDSDSELPEANPGVSYVAKLEASGGAGTLNWSVESGRLPSELDLDSETGIISGDFGVDRLEREGPFRFLVSVTDDAGGVANQTFTLPVEDTDEITEDLRITTDSALPVATPGEFYETRLEATPDINSLQWSVTSGELPDDLSLNSSTGMISGNLNEDQAEGEISFVIQVRDAGVVTNLGTVDQSFTLPVEE